MIKKLLARILSLPPVLFARRLFSDSTLGLTEEAVINLDLLKVSQRSVYGDRLYESRKFWNAGPVKCFLFFWRYGWPFSEKFQRTLGERFDGHTSPGQLLHAYDASAFHYAMLLMLSMHRAEWLIPFLPDIDSALGPESHPSVLDYGCGVSDFGLLLATSGAQVTIADLDNRKLSFAEWRYKIRNLECETISIHSTEMIPPLPAHRYDLIIASEILEHVRDPLELLTALTKSLKTGGLLFSTLGNSFEREIVADHLSEAIEIGNSDEYRAFFESHYEVFASQNGLTWLFRRRPES